MHILVHRLVANLVLPVQLILVVIKHVFSSCSEFVIVIVLCVSSVINFMACVRSRGHIFSPIITKLGQNPRLDKISDDFENGSYQIEN